MANRYTLTNEQRQQQVQDLTQQLEDGVKSIFESEKYAQYLNGQMEFMTCVQKHGMPPVPSEESAEEKTYVEHISALRKMKMKKRYSVIAIWDMYFRDKAY